MLETTEKEVIQTKTNIPIVFSCDNNYVQHLGCAIASILKNKKPQENLFIYVLSDDITEKSKEKLLSLNYIAPFKLEFIKIDASLFEKCPITNSMGHISIATYFRFVLPHLFADLDKILYLDCDINVTTSLSELYNTDIEEYYAAVVNDILDMDSCQRLNLKRYFNAGVMLVNLKKWRLDKIQDKAFQYCVEHNDEILWGDQDVLNVILQEKLLFVDRKWNAQTCENKGNTYNFNEIAKTPSIVHFITCYKPWSVINKAPNKKIYFEYLKLTPWKNKIWLYKLYSVRSFVHW